MFNRICAALLLLISSLALYGQSSQQATLTDLVQKFEQARHDFDLPAIASLAASNYVEISPLGEVDPREKMLGYYAPEKKATAPPMDLSDFDVRTLGDSAAIIAKITYQLSGRTMELRATYIAHHEGDGWKLIGVQYTHIQPGH